MGDPIVPMVGMAPQVSIDPISHVDEFLGHHDLDGPRLPLVDTFKVDEDCVFTCPADMTVRAAVGGGNAPVDPGCVRGAAGRDLEMVRRQLEDSRVSMNE